MTTVYDVPADAFIRKLAAELKKEEKAKPPEWAAFAKTGTHTEKAPEDPDWWYTRTASVLRKVYLHGPVGTERLAHMYGGYRDRGSRPDRAVSGSGSIARKALQRLEASGLVQNIKGRGRVVSPKGRSLCDNTAHVVVQELEKSVPALAKY
jgi:small subunit ribosomal protein S19e